MARTPPEAQLAREVSCARLSRFLRGCSIEPLDERRPLDRIPIVFQLNKRDLPSVLSCAALAAILTWPGLARYVPTIATRGEGVAAAVRAALELIDRSRPSPS